jgi:RNA polymerase sigma factor (sigma-70 family)
MMMATRPRHHWSARDSAREAELIRLAQGGDRQARNELIEAHMGFIRTRVSASIGSHRDVDEYIGIGVEAFMRCIAVFDPARGVKITSYSGDAITRAAWRALNTEWAKKSRTSSMDSDPNGRGPLSKQMQDTRAAKPHDAADRNARMFDLEDAISLLDDKERYVIRCRLAGETMKQIGVRLGLSRERVRQIELSARANIREMIGVRPDAA